MKILKHGTVNKVVVCGCGCEFEYDTDDIHHEQSYSLTTATTPAYVICPDCGAVIFLTIQPFQTFQLKVK